MKAFKAKSIQESVTECAEKIYRLAMEYGGNITVSAVIHECPSLRIEFEKEKANEER